MKSLCYHFVWLTIRLVHQTPFPLDIHYSLFIMKTAAPEIITPEKLPTPWLADSEWLLAELAAIRQDALRIPAGLDNASHINSVIDRCWRLEKNLRYLLALHREGQRAFAQKAAKAEKKARRQIKPHDLLTGKRSIPV